MAAQSGPIEVRHGIIGGSVVAAFFFSSADEARRAAEQVLRKKSEECFATQDDTNWAVRQFRSLQQGELASRDLVWGDKRSYEPGQIVVLTAYHGPQYAPSSKILVERVMPLMGKAEGVKIIEDISKLRLKR